MRIVDRSLARLLPAVPRPVVRHFAARYIAGPALDDAVALVRRLNGAGKAATVDVLGEEVRRAEEAVAIAAEYRQALERMDAEGLDANVSIKLTGLGLDLDGALCRENVESVVDEAARRGRFVRIDMEDASTTERTLALYRSLRAAGRDNVGVVLQARLRRTIHDIPGLDNVRLCKGIYLEPLEIAYREPASVRTSFVQCLRALVHQGSYVGIATHDEHLIEEALRIVRAEGLAPDRYEFQMLLGVRPERGDALVAAGHRLRIYVPYGTQWYAYAVRRLQENPSLAGYVAADALRAVLGR